jgi:hypothetical protein
VRDENDRILTTEVEIPAEILSPGPRGHRIHVVDYDSTTNTLYYPQKFDEAEEDWYKDPFEDFIKDATPEEILAEPGFHAQNVYAIVMRTLARFESALGRRISWGFDGHQIYVAPHAFGDANAFYSKEDRALAFGYFRVPGDNNLIFTCLSHDVVAHETTHAILDGLRERYTAPSSAEQAGFHEGFSDLVAILSVFSLKDVVRTILLGNGADGKARIPNEGHRISTKHLTEEKLRQSALFGLAEEMGSKLSGVRGGALRRSADLKPLPTGQSYLKRDEYQEPHMCGELLVAIMLNVFLQVWLTRLEKYTEDRKDVDVALVVDEGAESANHLLTMAIRALDYLPPTDMKFGDYLCALLTSDREMVPDDTKYGYREKLLESFERYGIKPPKKSDKGYWKMEDNTFSYDRTHFDSLMRDPNEIFRFMWDNRIDLGLEPRPGEGSPGRVYTKVQSVRPCIRVAPDGFTVRETVAEYVQRAILPFKELENMSLTEDITIADLIPDETEINLYGGGALIFDEYGKLKYHIRNRIFSGDNLPKRIEYLWRSGYLSNDSFTQNIFSRMHMNRVLSTRRDFTEGF